MRMSLLRKLFQQLIANIQSVFHILRQEFTLTFRDIGVVIFFIVVPLFYPLLYSYIYSGEVVREVPIVVVDAAETLLSRDYLRKVDATAEVDVVAHATDMREAQELLRQRKAYGIVYVPSDFSKNLYRGEQAHVQVFCDMSGLLYYKAILLSNTAVSLAMNKDIKVARSGATTQREEEVFSYPIVYQDVSMFNAAGGFGSFLLPAVLILIIQQTLLLGVGLSAGTARERHLFHQLAPRRRGCYAIPPLVLGKALCYFLIYMVVSAYVLGLVPYLFSFNQIGHPITLLLFVLPYVLSCIFFAMTLSLVIRNRETAMLIFVFSSVPLLFISGISWPGASIPDFWQYFSYLFPSTFGINGYVKIHSMGAELYQVHTEYVALWIQTLVYFVMACVVCRRQIYMSRREALRSERQ